MLPGFSQDSSPAPYRKPEKAGGGENVEFCSGCGIHNYGHVSELLTLRQATSYLVWGIRGSCFGRRSPEHFLLFLIPSS